MGKSQPVKHIEFFYKKQFYLFPQRTKLFADGNRVFAEISGKRVSSLNKYLKPADEAAEKTEKTNYKIGLAVTLNGSNVYKKYEGVAEYLKNNTAFDMMTFDYDTGSSLALCTFFKSEDMKKAEALIKEIEEAIPYLINIFNRPVIHLKDVDTVLPVDAVKRVTNNTFQHFMSHTRYWDNSNSGKVKPRSLLTKVYDDDYGIYENIVFKELIDRVLWFLLKRAYHLSEALFALNESVQLDPFKRINHRMYYLAIGKLYIGFSKTENSTEIEEMLKNSRRLFNRLEPYKICEVYAKNAGRKLAAEKIKQTNILTMHKDYRHVYRLYNRLDKKHLENQAIGSHENQLKSQDYYQQFCGMLALFALKNFSLDCNPKDIIFKDQKIDADFKFHDWNISLKSKHIDILDINAIELTVKNKRKATALFIPFSYQLLGDKLKQYGHIVNRLFSGGVKYDKYVFLEPFDVEKDSVHNYCLKADKSLTAVKESKAGKNSKTVKDLFYSVLPVSISEFNSFRRIQKILFECMVKSDTAFKTCAFCGEPLTQKDNKHICAKCRTVIEKTECIHCNQSFTATYADIKAASKKSQDGYFFKLPQIFKNEKKYLFRDIAVIKAGNYICPHCGGEVKIH